MARGPKATVCRRTRSGSSTTRMSGSTTFASIDCQVPCSNNASPTASATGSGPRSFPLRCTAKHDQLPTGRDHPREDLLTGQRRTRSDDDLDEPVVAADDGRMGIGQRGSDRGVEAETLGECRDLVGAGLEQDDVAHLDRAVQDGVLMAIVAASLNTQYFDPWQLATGAQRHVEVVRLPTDHGRSVDHPEVDDATGDRVLLDERQRMCAQIGRQDVRDPVRKQPATRTARRRRSCRRAAAHRRFRTRESRIRCRSRRRRPPTRGCSPGCP